MHLIAQQTPHTKSKCLVAGVLTNLTKYSNSLQINYLYAI